MYRILYTVIFKCRGEEQLQAENTEESPPSSTVSIGMPLFPGLFPHVQIPPPASSPSCPLPLVNVSASRNMQQGCSLISRLTGGRPSNRGGIFLPRLITHTPSLPPCPPFYLLPFYPCLSSCYDSERERIRATGKDGTSQWSRATATQPE